MQLGEATAEAAAEVDSDATGHTSGHTLDPLEPSAAPLPPPHYSVNTRSLKTPLPVPSTASAPAESLEAPSSLGRGSADGGGDNAASTKISDAGGNQALPAAYTAAPTPLLRPSPQSASTSGGPAPAAIVQAVQAVRTPAVVPTSAVAAAAAAGASSEEDVRRAYSEMKRAYDDMKV